MKHTCLMTTSESAMSLFSMLRVFILVLVLTASAARAQKAVYLEEVKKAADRGWREMPRILEDWKKTSRSHILWGYNAEANPLYLASVMGFLYEQTSDRI